MNPGYVKASAKKSAKKAKRREKNHLQRQDLTFGEIISRRLFKMTFNQFY